MKTELQITVNLGRLTPCQTQIFLTDTIQALYKIEDDEEQNLASRTAEVGPEIYATADIVHTSDDEVVWTLPVSEKNREAIILLTAIVEKLAQPHSVQVNEWIARAKELLK